MKKFAYIILFIIIIIFLLFLFSCYNPKQHYLNTLERISKSNGLLDEYSNYVRKDIKYKTKADKQLQQAKINYANSIKAKYEYIKRNAE